MYNRYVPQSDGSFRRSRVPEPPSRQTRQETNHPTQQEPERKEPAPKAEPTFVPNHQNGSDQMRNIPSTRNPSHHEAPAPSVGSFLKGLLPQNFDTEDLIVVLLLLLMSGNSGKDQNAALITLVIYLFL